jgi:hypothetical protein
VKEAWLADSIQKKEAQPLEAYDIVSDLAVEGKGIPWDQQDPSDEALESLSAEVWICFILLESQVATFVLITHSMDAVEAFW